MRTHIDAALAVSRPLAIVALAMIPLLALTVLGVIVDPTEISGAPAWIKPAKFAMSISVFCFTLLWILSRIEGRPRLVRVIATTSAVTLGVEWIVIALQAYRGTTSHFNVATPFDAVMFSTMGTLILIFWLMNLLTAILVLKQPMEDRAFAWSLRLGLMMSVLGGAMAGAMTRPTPDQRSVMSAGDRPVIVGAHAVGVVDGGAGLPITGWSTEGGDVRVPHFFGLHGLQAIPLLGWLLARVRRLRPQDRLVLIWIGGMWYLGMVAILFWQALRGESVVAPGNATLATAGLLSAATLAGTSIVLYGSVQAPPVLPSNADMSAP